MFKLTFCSKYQLFDRKKTEQIKNDNIRYQQDKG